MKPRDGAHEIVIHPEPTHRVVNSRIDPHRTLVGVLSCNISVHLEEIAVAFADGLFTETGDGC